MSQPAKRHELMFPRLTEAQIARLSAFARRRSAAAGEVIFEQGDSKRGFFTLITGSVEIVSPPKRGELTFRKREAGCVRSGRTVHFGSAYA